MKKISTFCRKRQKFQSPLEKNDLHQTPQNPHGGDKSPLPATLPKIYIVAILGMFATELFDQRVTLVFVRSSYVAMWLCRLAIKNQNTMCDGSNQHFFGSIKALAIAIRTIAIAIAIAAKKAIEYCNMQ